MTGNNFIENYYRRRAEAETKAKATFASACRPLRDMGVETVIIEYEGSGDSGCIDDIGAYGPRPESLECGYEPSIEIPTPLADKLEEAVYALLPGGWEINEGSYGRFVLTVADRRIVWQHTARSEEYDENEWDL